MRIVKNIDKPLFIISMILFALGLITIFSASNITAFMVNEADPSRYFMKELIFLAAGLVMSCVILQTPTSKYSILSWLATIVIAVVIVVLTMLGQVINGMSGWINYNGLGIQPSEFAKVAIIPLIATFYSINIKYKNNFYRMMVPMIVSLIVAGTIILQGDLGTAIIFLGLCVLMFFFSPVSKRIKSIMFIVGMILIFIVSIVFIFWGDKIFSSNELERFNYHDPCSRYITSGNQLCNGYIAINGGGLLGKGIGNSTQKYLYLPEAHTDFIFAIYVEETGVLGAVLLFACYFMLLIRIIVIGKGSSNPGNSLICYGVCFYIFMHILVNLTGVLGLLPMTGVPLPFMSYGGSICWCILIALTMVQRVAYENKQKLKKG